MENIETPPGDTITVRKEMLRRRVALSAANIQAANAYRDSEMSFKTSMQPTIKPSFDDNNETPLKTEIETTETTKPSLSPFTPRVSDAETFTDIILYKDPALSFLIIIAGVLSLGTIQFIFNGPHTMTFLSAVSYLMLIDLSINFIKSTFSSNSTGTWRNSIHTLLSYTETTLEHVATIHDQYFTCKDPALALKVAACLWSLAILGRYLSIWTLATLIFVSLFTIPYSLQTFHEPIAAISKNISTIISCRWNSLGLSRKQKFLAMGLAIFYVWMNMSWSSRCVAVLVTALAVRCTLKPAEVAALREHAAPLTMSVKKRAARLSIAATDFIAQQKTPRRVHFR